jgi:Flp pilus assembly pilin Flp
LERRAAKEMGAASNLTFPVGVYVTTQIKRRRLSSERGAAAVEYALLLGCILILSIGAVANLGQSVANSFDQLQQSMYDDGLKGDDGNFPHRPIFGP